MAEAVAATTMRAPASECDFRVVMSGAAAVEGGVSAVNLNLLEVLARLARDRGRNLQVLSYREGAADRPESLPSWARFRGFDYGKGRLTWELWHGFSPRALYFVDYLRLARPLLPWLLSGRARVVIFAHGWDYWKRLRPIDAQILKRATLCLTNSSFTLRKMKEKLPDFPGRVCRLGLSPKFALNSAPPVVRGSTLHLKAADGRTRRIGSRMLLLTGRMEPGERHKGHYPLVRCLPRLIPLEQRVQLVFAGPGTDRDNIARLARELRVSSRVFLPGHVTVETLSALYGRCHAFVMPSTQEGFGLVYLEAMNYSRPCVGCRDQGAEDVIVDGETGFLLDDPHDQDEMTGVLGRLLLDVQLADNLGRRGFQRLHNHFTAGHFQDRFRRHVESVL